jgi:uncharacterized membrane protein YqjE
MMQEGGLFTSVKTLLATMLGIAHTRLELIATELEEERLRLSRLLIYSLLALLFFGLAIVVLTIWLVVVLWLSHNVLAIGGVIFFYLSLAAWFGHCVLCQLKARPRLFSASSAELSKDRVALEAAK